MHLESQPAEGYDQSQINARIQPLIASAYKSFAEDWPQVMQNVKKIHSLPYASAGKMPSESRTPINQNIITMSHSLIEVFI